MSELHDQDSNDAKRTGKRRFPAERLRLSQWQKEIAEKLKLGGPIAISHEAATFLLADLKKAEDYIGDCEEDAATALDQHAATVRALEEVRAKYEAEFDRADLGWSTANEALRQRYGNRPKPTDFLDGNMIDRPQTRIEELQSQVAALTAEVAAALNERNAARRVADDRYQHGWDDAMLALRARSGARKTELRRAWEAGFKLCRGYGDNHAHFYGEQKERQWGYFIAELAGQAAIDADATPDPVPLAAEPRTGWQPIETAPKDGMPLLLWNGDRAEVAKWEGDGWWYIDEYTFDATHWMPLPAPPQEPTP